MHRREFPSCTYSHAVRAHNPSEGVYNILFHTISLLSYAS